MGTVRISGFSVLALLWSIGVLVSVLFGSDLSVLLAAVQVLILGLSFAIRSEPAAAKNPESMVFGSSHYELLEKLGEGGMGQVFRARQVGLQRFVAVKSIKPLSVTEEGRIRFRREARVLSSLFNPHTINVFDAGIRKDGSFYYVMEMLDGRNLEQVISHDGPLPAARVVHILRQTTMSLAEAHNRGLVHRDLKPANVMVCRYGGEMDFVKVLDFGLVKVAHVEGETTTAVTVDGAVPGTPAFMAPEAILGSGFVDARADLYSLGALGHYLLTGKYLFDATTPMAMVQAQLNEPAALASSRSPLPVPQELDDLIDRCLRKDQGQRPQSAEQLLTELEQLGLSHPWTREQAAACFSNVPRPRLGTEPPLPSELDAPSTRRA